MEARTGAPGDACLVAAAGAGIPLESAESDRLMARAWVWYVCSALPLTVVYYWLPAHTAKLLLWPIIGWSTVVAILVGVRMRRPEAPRAWYLLAAGVTTFIVGDSLYSVHSFLHDYNSSAPFYVNLVYLAMYPLLIAGLVMLVRRRTAGRDRAGVIDAAIITVGVGLVSWVLLIAPYFRLDDVGVFELVSSIAFPVGDIALLATSARLAVGGNRRPFALWLLVGSLVPLVASDALFSYFILTGTWNERGPVDVGWIAFYVGWGAAALHPSMRRLSVPTESSRRITNGRLVLLGSAVLAAPAMLLVQDMRGQVTDGTAIAVAGAVLFILVLVRIAGVTREAADVKSEARFRALVENASDAIVVLDAQGRVRYQTPATERVLGWVGTDPEGHSLDNLLEGADEQLLALMLSNDSATVTVDWRIQCGDDDWRDLEVVAVDMRRTTNVVGLVLTIRDVTERKRLDLELRRQALHDSLTGLPNRTLFLDRVEHALQRAGRSGGSVAVFFLDLDDFKVVNDSLGHAAGDDLLIAVASRLTVAMRYGDTVARLGGDEFALLLETGDLHEALPQAAVRIQDALRPAFLVRHGAVHVHASIGMAAGSPGTHTPGDLLRDADLAMYVAKRNGKDRFERYLPVMHEEASRRLEVAAELRRAIDSDELVVYYQPIVDVRSGHTCGAEALVRWQHPQRGFLAPNEFIPIAEKTGLIVPLGRWVLNEACRKTQEWKKAGIADESFYVSVNLSGRHVQDGGVMNDVNRALEVSGLAAAALVIEVTETALIKDLNPAGSTLATLKLLGLRIAVDDFGTGYSSLAYLSNFPIDFIKIDKSFVDRVATTTEGETMVRAVVDLTHTIGLTAIAEGVESADQALALERLGCRLAQGYLFARPMAASDMAALLGLQALAGPSILIG